MESKKCTKCGKGKPTTNFYKNPKTKDRLSSWCKSCVLQSTKKWKKNYPEKHKQSSDNWKENNPEKNKQSFKKWSNRLGAGVYALYSKGECLYVGESKQIAFRLWSHFAHIKNPKTLQGNNPKLYNNFRQHDYIYAGVIENCDNHKKREQYWINKLKPAYNG